MDSALTLTFKGPCGDIVNARGIICTTPMCRPVYEPVCGSDGVTYGTYSFEILDLKVGHRNFRTRLVKRWAFSSKGDGLRTGL